MRKVSQRHRLAHAPRSLNYQLIDDEGLTRHHGFIAGTHKGPNRQLDQFIGAVAEYQMLRIDPQLMRQSRFQIKTVPIRIKMKLIEFVLNGADRFGRWTQWVFIGSKLDGVGDAVFPLDLLDGLAWQVGHQSADIFRDVFDRVHMPVGYE